MKRYSIIIIIIFTTLLLLSCNRNVLAPQSTDRQEVVERVVSVRDTILVSDTASLSALVTCDSLGRVYLSNVTMLQGKLTSLQLQLDKRVLLIRALGRAQRTERHDSITRTATYERVRTQYITTEKPLSFWQKVYMWTGRLVLLIIIPAVTLYRLLATLSLAQLIKVLKRITSNLIK